MHEDIRSRSVFERVASRVSKLGDLDNARIQSCSKLVLQNMIASLATNLVCTVLHRHQLQTACCAELW